MILNNVWITSETIYWIINWSSNGSNDTKCVSLSNGKYEIQPTLIKLHPN